MRTKDELLHWALTYVTLRSDELFQSYQDPATGDIDEPEVREELADVQRWIDETGHALRESK